MESFSRLLNYLGNVKARITSKIVWIFFRKFLRLPARRARACGNPAQFLQDAAWLRTRALSCNRTRSRALRPIE
jgi:hypothetical protein